MKGRIEAFLGGSWPWRAASGCLDLPRGECYNPEAETEAGQSARPWTWGVALDAYELIVQSEFAAAHRLRGYEGNCERLHGHNWRVDVVLRGEALNELGMIVDFREARRLLQEVLGQLDHQYLNDLEPFEELNPTTEHLARLIYEALDAKLPEGVGVAKVTAWESDHCGVSYSRAP